MTTYTCGRCGRDFEPDEDCYSAYIRIYDVDSTIEPRSYGYLCPTCGGALDDFMMCGSGLQNVRCTAIFLGDTIHRVRAEGGMTVRQSELLGGMEEDLHRFLSGLLSTFTEGGGE